MRQALSKGVFRGSVTWKVSIQGGLLQKMMLESFGEVGQDGINNTCQLGCGNREDIVLD